MMRNHFLFAGLFISGLLLLGHSSEESLPLRQSLHKYLPAETETGGWERDGSPQEYKGEDLYTYIDGGAEIYHEYGFRQVIVQDYKNKGGKSISLEIFEMFNSESAYGMYTFKTSAQGDVLEIGDEALLEGYYMNFRKGNFLITLTGFDESEEIVKGLLEIGRAVDAKIKIRGKKPALASMLPHKDLLALSLKYFKGNLGLYNSYPFFTQDVFAFCQGIKGDYRGGYSVYIIEYESGDACQKRFKEVKTGFNKSPRYRYFRSINESLIRVEDNRGKPVFILSFKKYILIIVGAVSQSQAIEIFTSIQENI